MKAGGAEKTAVVIGAGNIGRGFIGPVFSASGYETVFIDVDDELVKEINRRGEYPLREISPDGDVSETIVRRVRAVSSVDLNDAAAEVARAEVCASAVGVRAMPDIAKLLAMGLALRSRESDAGPLDIIVCENLIDAGEKLKGHVKNILPGNLSDRIDLMAGFPEAVIGRMTPIQTDGMKAGDPLRICAEKYAFLPVDKAAFRGELPKIDNMIVLDNFEYYVKRKLFVHNLGHAAIAYLGLLKGYDLIADAVDDADVLFLAAGAMRESAAALGCENNGDAANLSRHIDNLLYRFSNRALKDTCLRVAADPLRKLGKQDRLIGAIENCKTYGMPYVYIAAVAAAAALTLEKTWEGEGEMPALSAITGLPADSEPFKVIVELGIACTAKAENSGSAAVTSLRGAAVKVAGDIVLL